MNSSRSTLRIAVLTAATAAFCLTSAQSSDWTQWRGPNFDGSSTEDNLPDSWSKTENVKWVTPLPGAGAATPAVVGDRVLVSSIHDQTKDLLALCLDRHSGKILWQHRTGSGFGGDNRSNKASPSPVTDGTRAIFYYGSGDLAAFQMDGTRLWARNIQEDQGKYAFQWTYSTSPLLHKGKLYIQVLQRDVQPRGGGGSNLPSYILALDPTTGETLWEHRRPSEARAESLEAFTTPIPFEFQGREEILVVGGDCITGHAPDTGRELWRWGTWNPTRITHWRQVPSAVAGDGIILVCAPKGAPIYAIRAGGEGTLSDQEAIAWVSEDRAVSSDVATPLFYRGRFYVLNGEKKILSCLEPKTGRIIWSENLDADAIFRASPTAADGKIYVQDHRGVVFVLAAGDEFRQISRIPMGEGGDMIRSSIVLAHGSIFVRTENRLYCIAD